ncbi:LIM domain transcription factor LMO4 [Arapaima gigas]
MGEREEHGAGHGVTAEQMQPVIHNAALFGNSGACSACGQSIPASELVMRAQGNVYHLKVRTPKAVRSVPRVPFGRERPR